MSKRRIVTDDAIAYVMQQPLEVAEQFVANLAAVVKARRTETAPTTRRRPQPVPKAASDGGST